MKIFISFLLILCFISASSSSSPVFISDGVFASEASIGRNLLQAKKSCSVNFQFMNYTIITSQCKDFMNYTIITSRCKGSQYPAKLCCNAFKDFACPYSNELNDLSNHCSSIMFSYINLYGKYPPGLFSNLCRDDKVGLICPALAQGTGRNSVGSDSNNSPNIHSLSILTLTVGFITFLLMWV